LEELDVSGLPRRSPEYTTEEENVQTAEVFRQEQATIVAATPRIRWLRPCEEDPDRQPLDMLAHEAVEEFDIAVPALSGSRTRGLLLHKLMEELLTGILPEARASIEARTAELLPQPHQLDIALALPLKPSARLNAIEISVNVDLQQRRRMISRRARCEGSARDPSPQQSASSDPPQIHRKSYRANHTRHSVFTQPGPVAELSGRRGVINYSTRDA
jgi:hypothetical protein